MEAFGRWSSQAAKGTDFEGVERLEEQYGERVEARDEAMLRLIGAAAPDLAGVALKIGLIELHSVWEMRGGEGCLAAVRGDLERMAVGCGGGGGRSLPPAG
jgi:hypothetical protein